MNWLQNLRPRIRALVTRKKDIPENLWTKCPACGQMLHHRELKSNLWVCQHCGHHLRVGWVERFEMLFDEGRYQTIELPDVMADPLKFRDEKRYADRVKEARAKTGQKDAVMVAHGKLGEIGVVVAVQNFAFMGGSMGLAVGEAILAAARLAVLQEAPLILFAAAGGARMQEGVLALMQMPRTVIAVQMLRDKGLPYIVVLTDPTTGGVTASYAMLGDLHIAEPGALIGFTGARVIENTIRERLPEGFQRAEYLKEHGMVDMIVPRAELKATLARVLDLLLHPRPPAAMIALPRPELEIPKLAE